MQEMPAGTPIGYSFGPFFLDTQRLALYGDGAQVDVSPRSLELMAFLVQSEGRVVSKDEIIEAVWRGAAVSDGNIARHIHMAREALGDNNRPNLYLKTVPGGAGYRFSGEATPAFGSSDREAARELRQFTAAQILSNAAYFAKLGTPPALESSIEFGKRALSLEPIVTEQLRLAPDGPIRSVFTFPPFRLDVRRRSLLCGAQAVTITPQELDALHILVARAGEIVSKDDLAWQLGSHDAPLSDASLTQAMYRLRRTLESCHAAEYIATIPRQGYQFVFPVQESAELEGPGSGSDATFYLLQKAKQHLTFRKRRRLLQ